MRKLVCFFLLVVITILNASQAQAQSETGDDPVYIVQPGDSLTIIAFRFGVPLEDIIAANQISNPDAIAVGTQLVIPGLEGIHGTLTSLVIPLGETLNTVAKTYQLDPIVLYKLNRITSPNEIYAGSIIIVPISTEEDNFAPTQVIQKGMTKLDAAMHLGVSPWVMMESNNTLTGWNIIPGEHIYGSNIDGLSISNAISDLIMEISISPLPLVQGETTELLLTTMVPLSLSGSLGEQSLIFHSIENNHYVALVGISALEPPGLRMITLTGFDDENNSFTFSQNIVIAPGGYILETVNGVDSYTIDPTTIEQENVILAQIQPGDYEKMWNGSFAYPVDEPCIGSGFGNRRIYSGTYNYYHTGVDFTICSANNKNIYAPAPGIVIYTGLLPIKGNFTLIDHGWGVFTGYAHQEEFLVEVGDQVETGQLLGIIGNTGRSVGPHLHWELWINGTQVNPLDWVSNSYP